MYSTRNLRLLAILQRFQSSRRCAHRTVRVRFAPSPTGHLHLGGLRTALYNYMFAKKMNGKFILRIEDTDQTRLVPGATESLIEDLLWSGIRIDEGPGSFGGDFGPYVQSERLDIYLKAMEQLVTEGFAYPCFCTEHRLDLLRKDAMRSGQVPRYDNKCRTLKKKELEELIDRDEPCCIRFRLTEYTEELKDLVYGCLRRDVHPNEGDPVIMKSDGFPTYHLANVVDDHMMGITHVFRGIEWHVSTPKHLLLYKALGWEPPQYGHLPLLVNPDGTKLSKRQGDISIKKLREEGYFPEALMNYVVTAGGGFDSNEVQELIVHSVDDLAKKFDITKLKPHPSRLTPHKLDFLNNLRIEELCNDKKSADELVKTVRSIVKAAYPQETNLDLSDKHILGVLKWSANRLTFLKDVTSVNMSFLWVKPDLANIDLNDLTKGQIEKLILRLNILAFVKTEINDVLKRFATQEGIQYATLMKTLRSALSGLKEGPSVAEMMEILGKIAVRDRLADLLKLKVSQNNIRNNKITKAA